LFSVNYMMLVAALVKPGRMDEALATVALLLELQPSYTIGAQCAAVDMAPALGALLTEAVQMAGLPL
jgi:hypothetical protein